LLLIFEDLHNSFGYEVYKTKREYYQGRFTQAFQEALPMVLFQYGGSTGDIIFTEGRITV